MGEYCRTAQFPFAITMSASLSSGINRYIKYERNVNAMKQFRRSKIAIVCYILAVLFAVYCVYAIATAIVTINQYYASYGMSPGAGEVVSYLFQSAVSPLTTMITIFMAGLILEEVRKLNPANWATPDEIAEAKEAKRLAREAKQIAKGEAAAAAATEEAAADADSESIKPEFAAVIAEESENSVVFDEEEDPAAQAEDVAEEVQDDAEAVAAEEAENTEFYADVTEEEA